MTDDDLVKFTAVLDEFAASQRAQALGQAKRQRVVVTNPIGDMQVHFETLVDEGSSAVEIFQALAPLEGALDRLRAQSELILLYGKMANICGQIEMSAHKIATDRARFIADNQVRNQTRRIQNVGLTDGQRAGLQQHRDAIDDGFARIEELKKAAAECVRVLEGESRFVVLGEQIAARLDALRGQRPDAA